MVFASLFTGLVVGFVFGVLFGRKNKNSVEKAVEQGKSKIGL